MIHTPVRVRDHFGGGIFCYFAQFLRLTFYTKLERICIKTIDFKQTLCYTNIKIKINTQPKGKI